MYFVGTTKQVRVTVFVAVKISDLERTDEILGAGDGDVLILKPVNLLSLCQFS